MIDVGGLPVALGWAPCKSFADQLLAVAAIPHSDHAYHTTEDAVTSEEEFKDGSIQFWHFRAQNNDAGLAHPAEEEPYMISAICFDWGRPKRMQWYVTRRDPLRAIR